MKHELSKTRLYKIYQGMKQRCYNTRNHNYSRYGGRGIKICDEWLNENGLQNFIEWSLNNGYNENLTIDRIDSDKDYCPPNCQWVTLAQNSSKVQRGNQNGEINLNNKLKSILSLKGLNMTRYAEHMGMSKSSLGNKAKRGTWNSDDLIKLAELTNTSIVFVDNETNKEIITLDENDIKKEPTNS